MASISCNVPNIYKLFFLFKSMKSISASYKVRRIILDRNEPKLNSYNDWLWAGRSDDGGSIPGVAGNFSLNHRNQNGSPASYPMDTRSSFSGGKAAGA